MALRRLLVLAALVPLLVVAGACSSSKKSSDPSEVTTTTIKRPAKDDPAMVEYCRAWRSIADLGPANLNGDAATIAQSLREHYGKVIPLATQAAQMAPAEIRSSVEQSVAVMKQVVQDGNTNAFHVPANTDNNDKVSVFSQRHCAKQ